MLGFVISLFANYKLYCNKSNNLKKIKMKHYSWVVYFAAYITFFIFSSIMSINFSSSLLRNTLIIIILSIFIDSVILDFALIAFCLYFRMIDKNFWYHVKNCGLVINIKNLSKSLSVEKLNTSRIGLSKNKTFEFST